MSPKLIVSTGQYSDKGRKETNQDFHGIVTPAEPLLSSKGIAVALADGISSSEVSQIASETAVSGFLEDYYCTSEAWSVKTSADRVLAAMNSWLFAETQQSQSRYDKDRGYVCTFSAMVIKSTTAHVFHVGDARIYLLRDGSLEQLTSDHRVWVSRDQSYLSRALGIGPRVEIDYFALQIEKGDLFILATDGVHEYVDADFLHSLFSTAGTVGTLGPPSTPSVPGTAGTPGTLGERDTVCTAGAHGLGSGLDRLARDMAEEALRRGSQDNLTVQLVRIETLPDAAASEIHQRVSELALAPTLEARMLVDGYRVVKEVHGSSRSHVFLAIDEETSTPVILKTPSVDLQGDPAYLERFLMEEWVARRINSPHVLKPVAQTRKRNYLYVVMELIDGQSLAQWMIDNPRPKLETVRGIVEQIAKGLRAFHRVEMLHQDLRPENIMIDSTGTVKIIDFGSTSVAGVMEHAAPGERTGILGTEQYAAPEYFLGEAGSPRSDLFSLGVITYQMLTGRLPYGTDAAKARTRSAQRKLQYRSALHDKREIPAWVDGALRTAVHPDPAKRYQELSEFMFDLRQPNQAFLRRTRPPLLERNPVIFWKSVSLVLALLVIALLKALNKT
ncbi:MAG: dual serine/threonine-protein kinase/phosphatase [Herminiimonas sp.]|nr:dual serine/threonine-protein kinase/phosphatase [Herminiimonas sp.]